ncbi:hypothetical protein ACIQB5_13820 [Streptomyces sp. NPDC088560]|uniref:hypothetical protein n=1 Tax=Streptomyces sp. NPDC088560 TaxID=3365868 RepID=UPI0038087F8B
MFSALAPLGWDEAWAGAFDSYAASGLLPGRVVRVDRGQCDVVTADGTVRADTEFVVPRRSLKALIPHPPLATWANSVRCAPEGDRVPLPVRRRQDSMRESEGWPVGGWTSLRS